MPPRPPFLVDRTRWVPMPQVGAPTTGDWLKGDHITDANGKDWRCLSDGTPGIWEYIGGGGGVSNFVELGDVPHTYTGKTGQLLIANLAENGLTYGGTALWVKENKVLVGCADFAREWPLGGILDHPQMTVDVTHLIAETRDRALYARNTANPVAATTMRTWGAQTSAEILWGNTQNFNCGYFGDLTGGETSAIHWGSGNVPSMVGQISQMTNRGGGHVVEMINFLALQGINAYPNPANAGIVDRSVGFRVAFQTEGYHDPLKRYGVIVDDGCGGIGIGYQNFDGSGLAVRGGIHAGGTTDPGAGNIQAAGTFKSADGSSGWTGTFPTGDARTVTVKNGIIVSVT